MRHVAMRLVYMQLECLLRDRMLSRKKKLRDINATLATHDFRDFFFPHQLAFWLIFQPRLKCNYGPFWHFSYSTLLTAWEFSEFVVRNCKILVQLSALFRKISSPLEHFTISNCCNILIFGSSWLSIPAIFRLKVAEKFSWLSWNSLSGTFSLTYLKPIS